MSGHQQRLEKKLADLAASISAPAAPAANIYVTELQKFAKMINDNCPWVFASVGSGVTPQVFTLFTRPRYQRRDWTPMLNFWIDNGKVRLLGDRGTYISSVDQLWEVLDEFYDNSQFSAALVTYKEISGEPIEGYLRTKGVFDMAPDDVLVMVDPHEQKRLAETVPGSQLTMVIKPERFPGAGVYQPDRAYVALESAGFGLDELKIKPTSNGHIEVTGRVVEGEEERGELPQDE
jgi:hypothetical protein